MTTAHRQPHSAAIRVITAAISAMACVLPLTGCFIIPLSDGRSPFDDPFGPSKSDVATHVPALQAQLDQIDVGDQWVLQASTFSDNCEGDCNLRLGVSVQPSEKVLNASLAAAGRARIEGVDRPRARPAVPPDVILTVLQAAAPTATAAGLNVSVDKSCASNSDDEEIDGENLVVCSELESAIRQLTGTDDKFFEVGGAYEVSAGEITLFTADNPDALNQFP